MCIAISENNWEKTYFYIRNLTFFDSEQQKLLKVKSLLSQIKASDKFDPPKKKKNHTTGMFIILI